MKLCMLFIGWLGAMAASMAGAAGAAGDGEPGLQNTFFVFCHDTHDAKKRNYAEQAEMISDLGFDGVGHLGLKGLPERLATLDDKGLKLVWLHEYVTRRHEPAGGNAQRGPAPPVRRVDQWGGLAAGRLG